MWHDAWVFGARWLRRRWSALAVVLGASALTLLMIPSWTNNDDGFEFSDPVNSVGPTTTLDPDAIVPSGFELVAARTIAADGTVCDLCLWLADSAEQRNRGLMFVTDLGSADGMAFRYRQPHATRFWMKDTPLPLSIAFYGPDRVFIDSFDMQPCVASDCVRFPTPTDFVIAVETYQGQLGEVGMLAGSTLELLDTPCQLGDVPGTTPNSG